MENNIFYPIVFRHSIHDYYNRDGSFYADYKSNYDIVSSDCLKRCVYCDATEKECGGDRFSLDHFRPRKLFSNKFNGILITHPYNLYLSCQKCNVLKSSDWHGCLNTIDGYTHSNKKGYLDRFSPNYSDYISVNNNGEIISIQPNGPVDYMIQKLHLNRPNRVYIRKLRIIKEKIAAISELMTKLECGISEQYDSGELTADHALKIIQKIQLVRKDFQSVQFN